MEQAMQRASDTIERLIKTIARALPLALFLAAAWVLTREIRSISAAHVWGNLVAISPRQWLAALAFTACGYVALTFYDVLGLRLIGAKLPYRSAAMGAFLSFSISNSVGLGWITGGSMRRRIYGPLGVSLADTARLTVLNSVTFFIGCFGLVGTVLVVEPRVLVSLLPLPAIAAQLAGAGLWTAIAGYLILCARRRAPIGWRDISLPVPHLRTAVTQIALSSTDILLAAGALYVLLPRGIELSFPLLLGIYLVALTASVLTHVPGGVGVLEAMVLWSLPDAPRAPVLASLMAFRIAYYLVPLAIALVFLARPAGLQLGHRALSWAGAFRPLVPLLAAVFSWLSGVFLLVSGAAPRLDSGVAAIRGVVPLPLLELSHLGGSIAGLGLVVLGGALYRRYDTARIVAILLLLVGAGAVVLHGQGETAALVLGGRRPRSRRAHRPSIAKGRCGEMRSAPAGSPLGCSLCAYRSGLACAGMPTCPIRTTSGGDLLTIPTRRGS